MQTKLDIKIEPPPHITHTKEEEEVEEEEEEEGKKGTNQCET